MTNVRAFLLVVLILVIVIFFNACTTISLKDCEYKKNTELICKDAKKVDVTIKK